MSATDAGHFVAAAGPAAPGIGGAGAAARRIEPVRLVCAVHTALATSRGRGRAGRHWAVPVTGAALFPGTRALRGGQGGRHAEESPLGAVIADADGAKGKRGHLIATYADHQRQSVRSRLALRLADRHVAIEAGVREDRGVTVLPGGGIAGPCVHTCGTEQTAAALVNLLTALDSGDPDRIAGDPHHLEQAADVAEIWGLAERITAGPLRITPAGVVWLVADARLAGRAPVRPKTEPLLPPTVMGDLVHHHNTNWGDGPQIVIRAENVDGTLIGYQAAAATADGDPDVAAIRELEARIRLLWTSLTEGSRADLTVRLETLSGALARGETDSHTVRDTLQKVLTNIGTGALTTLSAAARHRLAELTGISLPGGSQ